MEKEANLRRDANTPEVEEKLPAFQNMAVSL